MSRDFKRTDRVADQIQKELAQIVQRDLKDPRLGMVTISDVRVSKDFSYADCYFTVLNLDPEADEYAAESAFSVLDQASGYLRSELSHRIKLRVMPQLRFHHDEVLRNAQRLDGLIREARSRDDGKGSNK